ncbi:hypothetical protein SAMN05421790_10845 [Kroppenstedtia eburnea]|uniref:Uncharacterized protein n=1 Tax=Kroppenstedtia eburnea TaxID=714067 RepID=A0A1N7N8J6_9BACL|nr:hypothetical protein SAMN05421790_10845 [Kroppenstedtia eburnea]
MKKASAPIPSLPHPYPIPTCFVFTPPLPRSIVIYCVWTVGIGFHMSFSLFFRAKVIPCETQPSLHSETGNGVT